MFAYCNKAWAEVRREIFYPRKGGENDEKIIYLCHYDWSDLYWFANEWFDSAR
jgi:hypothetical protein